MKTVVAALVTLALILSSRADEQEPTTLADLKNLGYYKLSLAVRPDIGFTIQLVELDKNGAAYVRTFDQKTKTDSTLVAENSTVGAKCGVELAAFDDLNRRKWIFVPRGNIWTLVHPDNKANGLAVVGINAATGEGTYERMELKKVSTPADANTGLPIFDHIWKFEKVERPF